MIDIFETIPDPREIVYELDKHIIGQDTAKKTLAVLLLNRALVKLQRRGLLEAFPISDTEFQKMNALLIGPTGVGKTALIKTLERIADVPITIFDVTCVTSAGYVGGKIEDALVLHVNKCDEFARESYSRFMYESQDQYITYEMFLLETVETGIIYIDEFDKIRRKGLYDRDVSGDLVQNELLKIIEAGQVSLRPSTLGCPRSGITHVNTDHLFFICGGAFSGLEDIIQKRLDHKAIGFTSELSEISSKNKEQYLKYVTNEDLIEYGFKPELIGRLQLTAGLDPLNLESMQRIIVEPKDNLLDRYKAVFKVFDVDVEIDKASIAAIAQKALDRKTGARSLQSIFLKLFMDDLFNVYTLAGKKLKITRDVVENKLK